LTDQKETKSRRNRRGFGLPAMHPVTVVAIPGSTRAYRVNTLGPTAVFHPRKEAAMIDHPWQAGIFKTLIHPKKMIGFNYTFPASDKFK